MKILGDCQGKIQEQIDNQKKNIYLFTASVNPLPKPGNTMKISKRLQNWLYAHAYPLILTGMIRGINVTLRIRTAGEDRILELKRRNRRIVYALWHGRHFLVIPRFGSPDICVLTSTSRDGTLIADILKRFGSNIIPGSSHKSPVRALLTSIQRIKEGKDLIFAVDGPTGPIYRVKPGALFVAKKAGAVIVPVSFSYKPALVFNSWDRYMLPYPFAKVRLVFGAPFQPSDDLSEEVVERERLQLEETLKRLTSEADLLAGY
jgi:lysophospholipid acyltransferase (LPLAT)-like uncharacterized protein